MTASAHAIYTRQQTPLNPSWLWQWVKLRANRKSKLSTTTLRLATVRWWRQPTQMGSLLSTGGQLESTISDPKFSQNTSRAASINEKKSNLFQLKLFRTFQKTEALIFDANILFKLSDFNHQLRKFKNFQFPILSLQKLVPKREYFNDTHKRKSIFVHA